MQYKKWIAYCVFFVSLFPFQLAAESSSFQFNFSSFSRSDISSVTETSTKPLDIPLSGGASEFTLGGELYFSGFSLELGAGVSLVSQGIPSAELRECVVTTPWQEGLQFQLGRVSAQSVGPDPSGWLSGAPSSTSLITPQAPMHTYIDLLQCTVKDNSFFAHLAFIPFAPVFFHPEPEDPLFNWHLIDHEVTGIFSGFELGLFDYADVETSSEIDPACYFWTGIAKESFTVSLFGFAGPDRFSVRSFQYYRKTTLADVFNLHCRHESAIIHGAGVFGEANGAEWDIKLGAAWTGGRFFSQGKNVNIDGDWSIPVPVDSFDLSACLLQQPFGSDLFEISADFQYLVPLNPPDQLNLPTFSRISVFSMNVRPFPFPLCLTLDWTQSLQDGSFILGGRALFNFSNKGELTFAVAFPGGEEKTEFGQYRDRARSFFSLLFRWNVGY